RRIKVKTDDYKTESTAPPACLDTFHGRAVAPQPLPAVSTPDARAQHPDAPRALLDVDGPRPRRTGRRDRRRHPGAGDRPRHPAPPAPGRGRDRRRGRRRLAPRRRPAPSPPSPSGPRAGGVRRLTARVLPENVAALGLVRDLFPVTVTRRDDDALVLTAVLDTGRPGRLDDHDGRHPRRPA
ncbi:hypothetical protein HBB16_15935, partial [Pseudonocardia sp. MCCB 268]|nr:hypothetical protein [Pseudonocardia cytotoxica]